MASPSIKMGFGQESESNLFLFLFHRLSLSARHNRFGANSTLTDRYLLQFPTDPFTILELENPFHDVSKLHKLADLLIFRLVKGTVGVFS